MNNPLSYQVNPSFKWNGSAVTVRSLITKANDLIAEGLDYEKELGIFLLEWFNDVPYITSQTSGSTGTPKVIQIPKVAMLHSALATGDFFHLKAGHKALHCLSAKFIAGKMMLVRGLILGLEMDFVAPSATPLAKNQFHYDFVAMVPLQVQNSIAELQNVKQLIIGGAQINELLKQQLLHLPTKVYETYGMTETITHIAVKRIGESAFTVLPQVTIAQDNRNCLVIYALQISDQKIVTNDLVDLISETQFQLLGRIDNIVNSGGIKLIPERIEAKLSSKITNRFFVIGIPDERLGEKLILVLEGDKIPFDVSAFEDLSKYERPKMVLFIPNFKETENGKILRKETIKYFF
jgi:O-succinylbenzoic acid--CoA ligase